MKGRTAFVLPVVVFITLFVGSVFFFLWYLEDDVPRTTDEVMVVIDDPQRYGSRSSATTVTADDVALATFFADELIEIEVTIPDEAASEAFELAVRDSYAFFSRGESFVPRGRTVPRGYTVWPLELDVFIVVQHPDGDQTIEDVRRIAADSGVEVDGTDRTEGRELVEIMARG